MYFIGWSIGWSIGVYGGRSDKSLKSFKSNIQEFENLIKENQKKAKEFNVRSIKVVLELTEDTTKY